MPVLIALALGLVVWVAGSSLRPSSYAGFDWFLPTLLFVVLAVTGRLLAPFLRDRLRR